MLYVREEYMLKKREKKIQPCSSNSLWVCVIWGKYLSLIRSYIWQEVRKCSSVSSSFVGRVHIDLALEKSGCFRQPFSIARLCSLSLYIVNDFLKFLGQSQWSGILPLCTLSLGPNIILVCCFFVNSFQCVKKSYFCFLMIWLGLIVLRSWGSVCEQSPSTLFSLRKCRSLLLMIRQKIFQRLLLTHIPR